MEKKKSKYQIHHNKAFTFAQVHVKNGLSHAKRKEKHYMLKFSHVLMCIEILIKKIFHVIL